MCSRGGKLLVRDTVLRITTEGSGMLTKTRYYRACLCGLLFAGGCIPPQVRLPSLWYGSTAAQKREYEVHDPFPDTTIGPSTNSRPRNLDVQRSEPRRIREQTVPRWMGRNVPVNSGPAPSNAPVNPGNSGPVLSPGASGDEQPLP